MIGTIRKHSSLLWWTIIPITILSFVVFMGSGPSRNGNGKDGGTGYGVIYGHEITGADVTQARKDFDIYFLVNYGEWPEKNRNINPQQIEQQIYLNLLLTQKAKNLAVHVPASSIEDAASQMLRSTALTRALNTSGQPVPMDKFLENILKPRNFTAADFQSAVRTQLTIEQLRLTLGLPGALVTPQEAATLYDREHSEVSAQAVFFSASNYLSQVTITPADAAQFYTNYMSYYRQPERLQVNYVWFDITNFLAQSKAEWAKTNFEATVDASYRQFSTSPEFKDLKADEAKVKIREVLIQRRALNDAADQAKELVTELWAMEPVKPENIVTLAQKKGLTVKLSAPFAASGINAPDFVNAAAVEPAAFKLTAESPFSDRILGDDGIYVIGLANQLPSTVPAFAEIRNRVEQDLRGQLALALAHKAGTNFYFNAAVQTAAGKSFAQVAVAESQSPVILSPFSLSSAAVPEAGDRAEIGALKQAAFSTTPGRISQFSPTADGGFVMFVQKLSPPDAALKAAAMSSTGGFLSQVRRGRENEAFNIWVNNEANREFPHITALQKPGL